MKKTISIFNYTYRWNMTKIFDTWNWNDYFRKFDWHETVLKWNWNIQSKRKINTKISMTDQIKMLIKKIHSFVKIIVWSQNKVDNIKRELIITKKMLKIIELLSTKSMNQCIKFEYIMIYCKQPYYNCKWCDKNHENWQYMCFICKLFESCSHDFLKYVNCNQSHAANNKICKYFRILFIKSRENYENELWLKNQKFKFCNIMLQNQEILWYRVWNMLLIKKLI